MSLGGGWSWVNNFIHGLGELYTSDVEKADVLVIPSASMVKRDLILPHLGKKKIILRIDNFLKDSRNRGTGMPRMIEYAKYADRIVFQSEWARDYLGDVVGHPSKHHVILNGSPSEFSPGIKSWLGKRYLFVRQNRDDSKNPHMAFHEFQRRAWKETSELWICGKFSNEAQEWNFDLGDLTVKFLGSVSYEKMPEIMRQCDSLLYSYFADACSNTLNEALLTKMEIVDCFGMLKTGGAPELVEKGGIRVDDMMLEYKNLIKGV